MNTRSFIKSLLLCAAAPQVILSSSLDKQKWKATVKHIKKNGIYVPNPEYFKAEYEVVFLIGANSSFAPILFKRENKPKEMVGVKYVFENIPIRMNSLGECVQPIILQP